MADIDADKVVESDSNLGGRGLKAKCSIAAGARVMGVKKPLLAVLDSDRLRDTCYNCLKTEKGYRVSTADNMSHSTSYLDTQNWGTVSCCTACRIARYCSKECQVESWKYVHRAECKLFVAMQSKEDKELEAEIRSKVTNPKAIDLPSPKILPIQVRAVMRILLLRKDATIAQDRWDQIMSLESHAGVVAETKQYEDVCLMAKAATEYSKTSLNMYQVLPLLLRVLVNSFHLVTNTYDPIGMFLEPILAKMNHSCDFNAYITCTSGGKIEVIALKDIARGDEILVSYVDPTYPTRIRQKELKERFHFDCICKKCTEKASAGDYNLKLLADDKTTLVLKTEARVAELLNSAKGDSKFNGPCEKLQYAMSLLHRVGDWPLHQQPFPTVRQEYIVTLMFGHQHILAFQQACIQKIFVDDVILREKYHPTTMIHELVFMRLCKLVDAEVGRHRQDADTFDPLELDFFSIYRRAQWALGKKVSIEGAGSNIYDLLEDYKKQNFPDENEKPRSDASVATGEDWESQCEKILAVANRALKEEKQRAFAVDARMLHGRELN